MQLLGFETAIESADLNPRITKGVVATPLRISVNFQLIFKNFFQPSLVAVRGSFVHILIILGLNCSIGYQTTLDLLKIPGEGGYHPPPVNSPITMSVLVLFLAKLIVLLQQTTNINRITFTYFFCPVKVTVILLKSKSKVRVFI
jgi:hypothetical protein